MRNIWIIVAFIVAGVLLCQETSADGFKDALRKYHKFDEDTGVSPERVKRDVEVALQRQKRKEEHREDKALQRVKRTKREIGHVKERALHRFKRQGLDKMKESIKHAKRELHNSDKKLSVNLHHREKKHAKLNEKQRQYHKRQDKKPVDAHHQGKQEIQQHAKFSSQAGPGPHRENHLINGHHQSVMMQQKIDANQEKKHHVQKHEKRAAEKRTRDNHGNDARDTSRHEPRVQKRDQEHIDAVGDKHHKLRNKRDRHHHKDVKRHISRVDLHKMLTMLKGKEQRMKKREVHPPNGNQLRTKGDRELTHKKSFLAHELKRVKRLERDLKHELKKKVKML